MNAGGNLYVVDFYLEILQDYIILLAVKTIAILVRLENFVTIVENP